MPRASVPLSEHERAVLVALCRPIATSASSTPATNVDIGNEIFLAVDAVKAHLRGLFVRFGLSELPPEEKRRRLVSIVLDQRIRGPQDF